MTSGLLECIGVLVVFLCRAVVADILVVGGTKNDTMYRFTDQPAAFGPDIPDAGIEGNLVWSMPVTACETVNPPPDDMNVTYPRPWILLIKRGNCDFDTKVRNAFNAGYIAAIVYNNVSGSTLFPMSGSHASDISIPSVFVSSRDGLFLASDFLYTTGYYIVLTPDYPAINLNAILLPFAIVVGICFFVLTMVLVAKFIRDRRRRRRHRLPRSQLKKIAIKKFKKGEGNDVCAICLEEFEEGDKLRVLPCHHQYHTKCVDPWLLNNKRVCPVCKRKVIPGDDSDDEATAGQTPSESTPLLSPAHHLPDGPLQDDLPVHTAPPHLVNAEFASDDEYDADTEDTAHDNSGLDCEAEEVVPPTSSMDPLYLPGSPCYSPNSPHFSPSESAIIPMPSTEEADVPLIRLSDSQEIPPPSSTVSSGDSQRY